MKTSYVIIASLGLNAILVAGVVHKRSASNMPEPEASGSVPVAENKKVKGQQPEPALDAPVIVDIPGEPFSWRRVEAADYHKYVKNLRSIGCPEETVQDIIYSDVTKLYAEKMRALNRQFKYGASSDQGYWEVNETYSYNAERNRKYRELTEERKALLIELLGVDLEKLRRERMGYPDYEALRTAYLPEEKRRQVEDIRQRFQDMEQAMYQKYKEYYGEERMAEMEAINKQREAELAKILTPQEMEEYKLRNSQVAQQMKWSLQAFEPSEQEFRMLFKVEDQFADTMGHYRYGGPDPDDPVEQKRWADANKLKDEEYKKLLGEDRYKEYTRAKDYQYQELYRLAQRSGLPKETAGKVYDMKEAAEAQVSKLRQDTSLSSEQRLAAQREIRSVTEKAIQDALGNDKNFKRFQSQGGWWLRNLAPDPRPTSTAR